MDKNIKTMLTHIDEDGNAKMVDVSSKKLSFRKAYACGSVKVGKKILTLIKDNNIQKGDVLSTAKIAGILGAKKTGELIPLCHPLNLHFIDLKFQFDDLNNSILIFSEAYINAPTGVEMEALVAVNMASLTIYDMCKGVDKEIVIGESFLIKKSGGKSGVFRNKSKITGYFNLDFKFKDKILFEELQIIGILADTLEKNDILCCCKGEMVVNKNNNIVEIRPCKELSIQKGDKVWLK